MKSEEPTTDCVGKYPSGLLTYSHTTTHAQADQLRQATIVVMVDRSKFKRPEGAAAPFDFAAAAALREQRAKELLAAEEVSK